MGVEERLGAERPRLLAAGDQEHEPGARRAARRRAAHASVSATAEPEALSLAPGTSSPRISRSSSRPRLGGEDALPAPRGAGGREPCRRAAAPPAASASVSGAVQRDPAPEEADERAGGRSGRCASCPCGPSGRASARLARRARAWRRGSGSRRRESASESGVRISEPSVSRARPPRAGREPSARAAGAAASSDGAIAVARISAERVAEARVPVEGLELGRDTGARAGARASAQRRQLNSAREVGRRGPTSRGEELDPPPSPRRGSSNPSPVIASAS